MQEALNDTIKSIAMKSRDCPLCGSDQKSLLYWDRNRRDSLDISSSYLLCSCGFVYLDPIPDFAALTLWDRIYDPTHPSSRRAAALRAWQWLMRALDFLFDRTVRLHSLPDGPGLIGDRRREIIDVGCNAGFRLASFARRGWEIWGVDMSAGSLAIAREHFPNGRFSHGDVCAVDLPEDHFDAIRADAVWEHVEDPIGFARKCFRLLRPGGVLMLYVPNYESLLQKVFGRFNINSWVPFHINFFTEETARRCLLSGGFSNCEMRTNSHTSYLPLTIKQWLNRNRPSFDAGDLGWLVTCNVFYSPVKLLLDKLGYGEELVITARKPDKVAQS